MCIHGSSLFGGICVDLSRPSMSALLGSFPRSVALPQLASAGVFLILVIFMVYTQGT